MFALLAFFLHFALNGSCLDLQESMHNPHTFAGDPKFRIIYLFFLQKVLGFSLNTYYSLTNSLLKNMRS